MENATDGFFPLFANRTPSFFVASGLTVTGSILIVVTLIGSILIILTYHSEPKLQNLTNLWIVSMSLTDLLLAMLVMPVSIMAGGYHQWVFSQFFCDIFIMMDVLCCTCSIYHLCLISLDRYLCITQPLSYPRKRTKTATMIAIALCWLSCLALSLPPVLGWKNPRQRGECGISSWSYAVFSSVLSFYLPLVLILSAYLGMFRATKKQNKKLSSIGPRVAQLTRDVSRRMSRALTLKPQRSRKDSSNYVDVEESIHEFQDQMRRKKSGGRKAIPAQTQSAPSSPAHLPAQSKQNPNQLHLPVDKFESMSVTLEPETSYSPESPSVLPGGQGLDASLRLLETTDIFRKISASLGATARIKRLPTLHKSKKRLQKNRERQERKAGRVVAVVIVTFVAFWAPFFILNVAAGVCNCVTNEQFNIATWLGYANSAMNPMIYSIFNQQFRTAMVQVIKCKQWGKIKTSMTTCK